MPVGVLEPGGVQTELGSHNIPEIRGAMIDPFFATTELLGPRGRPAVAPK